MAKTKISEFSATANSNTDINSINIAEGCAPSNINDAIRELMAELKDFQAGTKGDSFNGPVGTTTSAAGAFTTLSSTGNTTLGDAVGDTVTINGTATFSNANPTLSAGTANGVLYLNGSKVATSGSALTFDGTNLGVGGVPTIQGELNVFKTGSAPTLYVQSDASNSTTQGIIRIGGASGRSASIQGYRESGGSNYHALRFYSYNAADQLNYEITSGGTSIWSVGGSEQMRLTSTGLGIGTSSPSYPLHVVTSGTTVAGFRNSGAANGQVIVGNTAGDLTMRVTSTGDSFIFSDTSKYLAFGTSATERMRLDTSGNLGLGVTPSAWGSGYRGVDLGSNSALYDFTSGTNVQSNLYCNGYVNSSSQEIYKTSAAASAYRQIQGSHRWYTAPSGTAGNAITFTQAMTLDASGQLGIAVTSPAAKLDVLGDIFARASTLRFKDSGNTTQYGAIYGDATSFHVNAGVNNLIFYSAGSERARIDSSGNLLVGAASGIASERLFVSGSNANYIERVYNSNASPYGIIMSYTGAAPNGTSNEFLRCDDTGAARMTVRSNGGIANYQANNVNLSDRQEKTNFAPAGNYLAKICAIPVQTFNYIDQAEDDAGLTLGVVAQDVQAVAPELVMESNWGTEEEPKMRLSIYQTDLQYALMKCIQEQQAIIEQLKARLDAANL